MRYLAAVAALAFVMAWGAGATLAQDGSSATAGPTIVLGGDEGVVVAAADRESSDARERKEAKEEKREAKEAAREAKEDKRDPKGGVVLKLAPGGKLAVEDADDDDKNEEHEARVPGENEGWAGLSVGPIPPALAAHLRTGTKDGVMVLNVVKGSPADKAGIQQYDVIVSVGKKGVKDAEALTSLIRGVRPGSELTLAVVQKSEMKNVPLMTGRFPGQKDLAYKYEEQPRFGMETENFRGQLLQKDDKGNWVIRPMPGGVITDPKAIESLPPDVRKQMEGLFKGSSVMAQSSGEGSLVVSRSDGKTNVEIKKEANGKITVTRKDERGFQTKTYESLEQLKKDDPKSAEMLMEAQKGTLRVNEKEINQTLERLQDAIRAAEAKEVGRKAPEAREGRPERGRAEAEKSMERKMAERRAAEMKGQAEHRDAERHEGKESGESKEVRVQVGGPGQPMIGKPGEPLHVFVNGKEISVGGGAAVSEPKEFGPHAMDRLKNAMEDLGRKIDAERDPQRKAVLKAEREELERKMAEVRRAGEAKERSEGRGREGGESDRVYVKSGSGTFTMSGPFTAQTVTPSTHGFQGGFGPHMTMPFGPRGGMTFGGMAPTPLPQCGCCFCRFMHAISAMHGGGMMGPHMPGAPMPFGPGMNPGPMMQRPPMPQPAPAMPGAGMQGCPMMGGGMQGCPMMGGMKAAAAPAPAMPGAPMTPGTMMPGCPMMGGMKAPAAAPAPAMPGAPMTPGMMMPGCPMMGGIAAPAPVPAPAKPGTPMAPGMMMPGCPMMGGMKAPAAPAPAMPGAPMTPGCPMMGGMNPPTPKAPAAPAPGTPVAPPTGMEMLPWSPWMVPGVPGPMPAAPAVTPAPAAPGAPVRMQVREMPHPQAMPGAPMPTAVSHDRNEFKIGAEGKVTATVTRGENTLTIEFKSAEDLRERYPRLFEAFKTMTDGLREPGRR